MITVIIPTLNEERRLPRTLAALVPAMIEGAIKEVIVVDGGSSDKTRDIADDAGAHVIQAKSAGRGGQLAEGAIAARAPWLLFLHADTILADAWVEAAAAFMRNADQAATPHRAAAFTFALDDSSMSARLVALGVTLRARVLKLPYGDQGLLISKSFYDEVGGMRPLPLMEDVDIVRRIGGRRLAILAPLAVTSADRYRRDGYFSRILRNWSCLLRFAVGQPIDRIAARYERKP